MTDYANELRRHADKIGRPAGDTPAVMHAAAANIEDLELRLREAEKDAALDRAIQKACGELPEGFSIIISLENGAGYPELYNQDGDEVAWHYEDKSIADTVLSMLEYVKNQPAKM